MGWSGAPPAAYDKVMPQHRAPMRITDSEAELHRQLIAAGLDPEHLEPWEAWKAFKRFLATPMAIDDEGISVQCRREEADEGARNLTQGA